MMLSIESKELKELDGRKLRKYLVNNVFGSKKIIGRIKKIVQDVEKPYMFITLVNPLDIYESYKLDGEDWDIYCDIKKINPEIFSELDIGNLISFEFKKNTIKEEKLITANGSSVNKLNNIEKYISNLNLKDEDFNFTKDIALDNGKDISVLVSDQFMKALELKNKEIIEEIEKNKNCKSILEDLIKEQRNKLREIEEIEEGVNKKIKLLNIFGLEKILEPEEANFIESLSENTNFDEKLDYLEEYLRKKKGLFYDKATLRRFLGAISCNELIILTGPSGTGKTSLATGFSEAVGGEVRIISVKPSWTDTEDLIGFYNPIERRYIATPFLDALVEARKKENENTLFVICLDEMNLAHVEYYFAEFLSKLEATEKPFIELYSNEIYKEILEEIGDEIKLLNNDDVAADLISIKEWMESKGENSTEKILSLKKKIKLIEKYPAKFYVPNNVRFIGTMNIDQTTKGVSPKVIDRSYVIELSKTYANTEVEYDEEFIGRKICSKDLIMEELDESLYKEILEASDESKDYIEEINEKYLGQLNSKLNARSIKHIKKYINNVARIAEKREIIEDIMAIKILPRINTSYRRSGDSEYKAWESYMEYIRELELDGGIIDKISRMD